MIWLLVESSYGRESPLDATNLVVDIQGLESTKIGAIAHEIIAGDRRKWFRQGYGRDKIAGPRIA